MDGSLRSRLLPPVSGCSSSDRAHRDCRSPITWRCADITYDPRTGKTGRRDDALRDPAYRLPREVLDGEIARILSLGVELECDERVDDLEGAMPRGQFDAPSCRRRAHRQQRRAPWRDGVPHPRCRLDAARTGGGEKPQLGRRVVVYGGGDTALDAARTAKRLGAAEPVSSIGARASGCRPTPSELEEAERRESRSAGSRRSRRPRRHSCASNRWSSMNGFPQPTGEFEDSRLTGRPRARPGRRSAASRRASTGSRSRTAWSRSTADDDRPRGLFAGAT